MTSASEAIVRLQVEPGPRTRVRNVQLDFSGPVLAALRAQAGTTSSVGVFYSLFWD
jgi:hypothetical protein